MRLRFYINPNDIPIQIVNKLSEFYIDCLYVWFKVRCQQTIDHQRRLLWNAFYSIFVSRMDDDHLNVLDINGVQKNIENIKTKVIYDILIEKHLT